MNVGLPNWILMWVLAVGLALGAKVLTWAVNARQLGAGPGRTCGYFFAWVGLNAGAFLDPTNRARAPKTVAWWQAAGKILLGTVLIWVVSRQIPARYDLAVGWTGLVGTAFVLNFGLFHLLALCWQQAGVQAPPIMRAPARATSVAEFWNRRWNVAFNELVHQFVFRPVTRWTNPIAACAAAFLVSSLAHEVVISLPAGGGYGWPTFYFLFQFGAMLLERTQLARALGLRHGWRGWLFTAVVTAGPAFWLFHPVFIRNVVLPMMAALGAI